VICGRCGFAYPRSDGDFLCGNCNAHNRGKSGSRKGGGGFCLCIPIPFCF
jgi:hypothetical protein